MRQCARIDFENAYSISIQCSSGHYCSPRIDIDDPSEYIEYEIGIFYKNDHQNLPKFTEIFNHISWEDNWLGAYVPASDVQDIINFISKIRTPELRKKTIKNLLDNFD